MAQTPASPRPLPPCRPSRSALKLQQERLELDNGKTAPTKSSQGQQARRRRRRPLPGILFNSAQKEPPLPPAAGLGPRQEAGGGRDWAQSLAGLHSRLSRRPRQGCCSQVAAFPSRAPRDESSRRPASSAGGLSGPRPGDSSAAPAPRAARGRGRTALAPPGCRSRPACGVSYGSGPRPRSRAARGVAPTKEGRGKTRGPRPGAGATGERRVGTWLSGGAAQELGRRPCHSPGPIRTREDPGRASTPAASQGRAAGPEPGRSRGADRVRAWFSRMESRPRGRAARWGHSAADPRVPALGTGTSRRSHRAVLGRVRPVSRRA